MRKGKDMPGVIDHVVPTREQLQAIVQGLILHCLDEYMKLVERGEVEIKPSPPIMAEIVMDLPPQELWATTLDDAVFYCTSDPVTGIQRIMCGFRSGIPERLELTRELTAQVQLLIHERTPSAVKHMISDLDTAAKRMDRRRHMLIRHYAHDLFFYLSMEERR